MTWQVDKSHSHIYFNARHMMISKVRGSFEEFDIDIDFDPQNPAKSVITTTIAADSINTRDERRDTHLKSPDFLDAAKYPTLTFKSTRIEQTDANHGKLYGDLTIAGATNEVVLDVTYAGVQTTPWGGQAAGFSGTTSINRKDWGLEWNVALETGGWLVSDTINIEIELELVPVQEEVPQATA